jgi:hypothetical protein
VSRVEFDYRQETVRGETVYRPVARVALRNEGKTVVFFPYIDSGADVTLIPRSIGEALGLGLNKSDIEELAGIGEGKVAVVRQQVGMSVGSTTFPCEIAWALIEEVPPLLGRKGVFDRFSVEFREWERKVVLVPRPETPTM